MIPRTLAIMLTNKCNFYCDHCSVCAGPDVNDALSDEIIRTAISQAYHIPSIRVVSFTGGEVTLYPEKLKMAIAYAHEKGIVVCVERKITSQKSTNEFSLVLFCDSGV